MTPLYSWFLKRVYIPGCQQHWPMSVQHGTKSFLLIEQVKVTTSSTEAITKVVISFLTTPARLVLLGRCSSHGFLQWFSFQIALGSLGNRTSLRLFGYSFPSIDGWYLNQKVQDNYLSVHPIGRPTTFYAGTQPDAMYGAWCHGEWTCLCFLFGL